MPRLLRLLEIFRHLMLHYFGSSLVGLFPDIKMGNTPFLVFPYRFTVSTLNELGKNKNKLGPTKQKGI